MIHLRAAFLPLIVVALAGEAAAQRPAEGCSIAPIRGASTPGGAVARVRMVNRGQACEIATYGDPEQRGEPARSGRIVEPPLSGVATFIAPRVRYVPNPGFAGRDEFVYEAQAVGRSGQTLRLLVRVQVTVEAPRRNGRG